MSRPGSLAASVRLPFRRRGREGSGAPPELDHSGITNSWPGLIVFGSRRILRFALKIFVY